MIRPTNSKDRSLWFDSVLYSVIIVAVMWAIFLLDREFGWNVNRFGLRPQNVEGLTGILTMPFLHGDLNHIFNNTSTLLVLLWALIYFYRELSFKVLGLIWFMHTAWLWLLGEAGTNHIGASGVVYGLGFFLFFSGIIRKKTELIAISLLMLFMYGSMVWGIFPSPLDPQISWMGHLCGAVAGVLLAFYYRKQGPQKKVYQWELDEIEAANNPYVEEEYPYWMEGVDSSMDTKARPLNIRYIYVPKQIKKELDGEGASGGENDASAAGGENPGG